MAAIVNAADQLLQATSPRVLEVSLPPNILVPSDNVTGLPEAYDAIKSVELSATSLVFQVPKVGAISPTSIAITARLKNIVGTPTWSVTSGTATLDITGNTATIIPSTMTTQTVTVEVSVLANSTTYTDKVTIAKLAEGNDAIVGLLSNESVTIAADSGGTVTGAALASAGGTFYIFQGVNNKTGDAAVTYSVMSQSGMSVSIASTGVYTVSAVTADTAFATLRAVYSGVTIDKVLTIAKSKSGTNGTNGIRGNANISVAISGSTWTDAAAVAALSSNGLGAPQNRDIVTEYNISTSFSQSKFYDSSSSSWLTLDAYINGNLLVAGTVAANKLNVTSLSSITANIGTITAGILKSVSVMGGAFTGWAWPAAGNYGFYLGPEGILLGNANNGKYVEITADGQFYAPGFSIVDGNASFSGTLSANIVNTNQLVVNSVSDIDHFTVTIPAGYDGSAMGGVGGWGTTVSVSIPSNTAVLMLLRGIQTSGSGLTASAGFNRTGSGAFGGWLYAHEVDIMELNSNYGKDVGSGFYLATGGTFYVDLFLSNTGGATLELTILKIKR